VHRMWQEWESRKQCTGFWLVSRMKRDKLESLGIVNGKLLRCILKKEREILWGGLICQKRDKWRVVVKEVMNPSSSSTALQPGVDLGLLYNTPPSLSIPCSVPPFVYSHLSKVTSGHVIQPSHFWSSSSSCCIQLSVHLFRN
jgi:hypothetical protein